MPQSHFALRLSCVALLVATVAHAGPREDAEQRFRTGVALQKVEDWEAAVVEYKASLELYATKGALFNLANALRALHRYAEALATLERLQRDHGAQLDTEMREAADALTAELRSLTATLRLEVEPPGAVIRVDGEPVGTAPLTAPLRLGVGSHRIEASLDGYAPTTIEVNLASREERTQELKLTRPEPEPKPPPPPPLEPPLAVAPPPNPTQERRGAGRRTTAWVTAGAGVALLGAGTVTGVWALTLDDDLQDDCLGGHCPDQRADDITRLELLAPTTDALLVLGTVTTAAGVTLWVVDHHQRRARGTSLHLMAGPGSASVALGGSF